MTDSRKKFDDNRIKKIERLISNELLKSPYTNQYTEDEINEAKKRIADSHHEKVEPVSRRYFAGWYATFAQYKLPNMTRRSKEEDCFTCKLF